MYSDISRPLTAPKRAVSISRCLEPGLTAASLYVSPEKANDYELGVKIDLVRPAPVGQRQFVLERTCHRLPGDSAWKRPHRACSCRRCRISVECAPRRVETEVTAKPVDWLAFDLNASYNDAVYTSYANAPCSVERASPVRQTAISRANKWSALKEVGRESGYQRESLRGRRLERFMRSPAMRGAPRSSALPTTPNMRS